MCSAMPCWSLRLPNMLDTFQSQCLRKLRLCWELWPGPRAEMLLSHSLLMKATVSRSVWLSAIGQYPASCCGTTFPGAFTPGSKLRYTEASVGCSEGASDAKVLLGWPWQLEPQQKAGIANQGKKLGCRVNTRIGLEPVGMDTACSSGPSGASDL